MTDAKPATPAPSAHPPPVRPALTQACVRCGREVPLGTAMCEFCNPLGLAQPAATQAHGTIFLAIGSIVVVMALVGRLLITGMGPFQATVDDVSATTSGLAVTLSVTNLGSRSGSTTCRVFDPSPASAGTAAFFQSPPIEPGTTETFTRETAALGPGVRPLQVECSSP